MNFQVIDPELLDNALVQEQLSRMALAIQREQERQLQEQADEEGCSEVFAELKLHLWGGANASAPAGARCNAPSLYPK